MRVAYDHQAFCRRPYTGISRYIVRLVAELSRLPEAEARIFAPLHVNRLLHAAVMKDKTGHFLPWHPLPLRPLIRAASGGLARAAIRRWQPHVVHETYYASIASAPGEIPVVLTIYDLIHERYPGLFPFHARTLKDKARAIARADALIAISAATADELRQYYPDCASRLVVIHLGVDIPAQRDVEATPSPTAKAPYLLYVGERGGYKNFSALLQALAGSSRLQRDFRLLCCGGGSFSQAERQQLAALQLTRYVEQRTATDTQLDQLYRQATALVYPSRHEGFGLPLLEAMARGCPVIASNAPALREVAGEAALFFDPDDVEALRVTMEQLVDSPTLIAQLRATGQTRLSAFTWPQCARQTLALYLSLGSTCAV